MASVEERLKLKRGQVDTWSTREKLCLASCVVRSGNQNWTSVIRNLKTFAGEPGRPDDWFSQKSCAVQYDNLLTHIETPKRKKRGADGTKTEGPDLTPAEVILKQLTVERIEELRKEMEELRDLFKKFKEESILVESGQADDRLEEMLQQIKEDKLKKEAEQEENARWIRQREERKLELELACRPHVTQQHYRNSTKPSPAGTTQGSLVQSVHSIRRTSSQSEISSEAESNVDSPVNIDSHISTDEAVELKPAPTPTSPLLTSLLKSPSPVTATQSSILHSAITSQRGASPTITSLLNSSPSIPSATTSHPVSPNIKSLVSNALAGHDDVPKSLSHTSGTLGSPTLSMLLELPPSAPGQPLPELPYSATKQPLAPAPAPAPAPTSTDATPVQKAALSAANDTEPSTKEPLPDLGNVEIVLPIETEAKISEAERKLNLDPNELQDLSNSDLELVMDQGMDVVLEELVPEGLVEEMSVFIEVSSEDVETSVNNILEATEQLENSNVTVANEEQQCSIRKEVEQEILPEPQDDTDTLEDTSKAVLQPSESDLKRESEETSRSNETISREALENASIVIVQDNGELVKLQDGLESASVMGDIQIIQDTSNNEVVVMPLQNVGDTDKEDIPVGAADDEQGVDVIAEKDSEGQNTQNKEETLIEIRESLPAKPEKPDNVEEDSLSTGSAAVDDIIDVENVSDLKDSVDSLEDSNLEKIDEQNEIISVHVEQSSKEDLIQKVEDLEIVKPLEQVTPKETKRRKSLSLQRKEKLQDTVVNADEVIIEENTGKADVAVIQEPDNLKEEIEQGNKVENADSIKEKKISVVSEILTHIKEEKLVRADTPSTEDDKSRDAEQSTPQPVKPRRGRLGRDSAAYTDSVPNSPTPSSTPTDDEKDYRVWKKSIMLVYGRIAAHKNASIFFRPITDDKAPGYSQMIFRPTDLSTIKKNVETGVTRTTDEFQRDILLMFNNAIMYNKTGTPVHDMAREMQDEGAKHLQEYVNTQLLMRGGGPDSGHIPSRRGTRTAEKRDQDADSITRRGLGASSKGGTPVSTQFGKRKRSLLDDKSTPKRRKDDD